MTTPTPKQIQSLFDYLNTSLTAFHTVSATEKLLKTAGFKEFSEKEIWETPANTAGYVIRNHSGILAFRVGSHPAEGFRIVAAHTDSPSLKIKWAGAHTVNGFLQLPVEVYGGPILSTWLDKPLTIAGRYVSMKDGKVCQKLVQSSPNQATIPNLAIHMNHKINNGFSYNPQTHLTAFCGDTTVQELLASMQVHDPDAIQEGRLECFLADSSQAALLGQKQDWLQSPRLDNLASCYAAATALVQSTEDTAHTKVIFLSDNEEVGNLSAAGAASNFLRDTLTRLIPESTHPQQFFLCALAKSQMLSEDAAHATHPSYPESCDSNYPCLLNSGPVVKENGKLRYATNAESQASFQALCKNAKIPLQSFIMRSDLPCGTTIGPVTSAKLGIPTVDIGIPMWSMHSARETAGIHDLFSLQQATQLFLEKERYA
ncbi:MAG: M18 family aminopeptidase [Lentisphaeria bacterium]